MTESLAEKTPHILWKRSHMMRIEREKIQWEANPQGLPEEGGHRHVEERKTDSYTWELNWRR